MKFCNIWENTMKIRFIKNCLVEVVDARDGETYDKQFLKWSELRVEELNYNADKKTVHVTTYEGDILLFVRNDAFEVI